MCVQNFDDSRSPAIRITYRISLRSSSLWEPRHPSLKVVFYFKLVWGVPEVQSTTDSSTHLGFRLYDMFKYRVADDCSPACSFEVWRSTLRYYVDSHRLLAAEHDSCGKGQLCCYFTGVEILDRCVNDPSAGSPTETLLRLHLPLSDKVYTSSRQSNSNERNCMRSRGFTGPLNR